MKQSMLYILFYIFGIFARSRTPNKLNMYKSVHTTTKQTFLNYNFERKVIEDSLYSFAFSSFHLLRLNISTSCLVLTPVAMSAIMFPVTGASLKPVPENPTAEFVNVKKNRFQ